MKQTLAKLILAATLTSLPLTTLAAETLPTPIPSPGNVPSAQQSAHLNRLKTHGASEIDRRLSSLQAALNKLQASTTLADADKKALAAGVQAEIDGLATLKDKLAAETNLDAARADVQSIFTEYRVYALLLPKARLVTVADRAQLAGKKFQELAGKLQVKVTALKAGGTDVTQLQKDLDAMNAKLTDAKTHYDGLPTKLLTLKPTDYNADHKVLRDYRDDMKAVRADFKAAHDAAQDVILGLKDVQSGKSPSPSASPSLSPSPSPNPAH
jgi:DNA repair exonuclease SbcCD ATPase subunit